jgi:xanthine dehydrogenase small subunit
MRDTVRFLLGHALIELGDVEPTLTVLDWLRLEKGRTGTKEGCAEGDCGACTVVVARLEDGRLVYRAVNSCILFLAMLDGCQLLTVEDLQAPDGALHPVQQAMVDCHGSQCGFCTPGFVMSLFALYRNEPAPPEERVDDALAGNLCRCTGYAPIVKAAALMYELGDPANDGFAAREAETVTRLEALQDGETLCVGREDRKFYAPADADSLADLLLEIPDARIVAGATDVGLWVTKQLRDIAPMIHIGRVRELGGIAGTGDALTIGAGVTYDQAAGAIAAHYPDAGELIRRLGGLQVRNIGTIGGNIANGSPIGDMPPVLIAADASLVLRRGGERRTMPLEDFFIDYGRQDRAPGEFVEAVILPKPEPGDLFRCYKITKRFDQDISAVCGAFRLRLAGGKVADIRIAFGGMAATPKRAAGAEAALTGKPWTENTVESALSALEADYTPLDDWRASAWYRTAVARNLLRKFLLETTEPDTTTRLVGAGRLVHV